MTKPVIKSPVRVGSMRFSKCGTFRGFKDGEIVHTPPTGDMYRPTRKKQ